MSVSLPYRLRFLSGLVAALFLTTGLALPASAAHHRRHAGRRAASAVHGHWPSRPWSRCWPSPTDPEKDAALIMDGATGKVLYARNETAERHPASLTKMMTLYLLFEALKAGKVTMQTQMPVSLHARSSKPTKLTCAPARPSTWTRPSAPS